MLNLRCGFASCCKKALQRGPLNRAGSHIQQPIEARETMQRNMPSARRRHFCLLLLPGRDPPVLPVFDNQPKSQSRSPVPAGCRVAFFAGPKKVTKERTALRWALVFAEFRCPRKWLWHRPELCCVAKRSRGPVLSAPALTYVGAGKGLFCRCPLRWFQKSL